jgi:hypothetical protein
MKSNYSAKGEIKSLLWDLGIFKSTVGVGGVIETLKVQAGESEDEAKIRYAKQLLLDDQHEFLRMLDKYTAMGDRLSSAVTARNNAATIFSRDSDCNLNGENGYRKLRAAMERLFASGHIQTIEEGSLSKRVRFIKKVGLQVVKTDTTMVSDPQ